MVEREIHAAAVAEAQRAAERNAAKTLSLRAGRARVRFSATSTQMSALAAKQSRCHAGAQRDVCAGPGRRALARADARARRCRRRRRRSGGAALVAQLTRCRYTRISGRHCANAAFRARGWAPLSPASGARPVACACPHAMQALRLSAALHAAAPRGAAPARCAASRCAAAAPRRALATRARVLAAPAPRSRRALRVRADSTIVDVSPVEVTDITANRIVVIGGCVHASHERRLRNCHHAVSPLRPR